MEVVAKEHSFCSLRVVDRVGNFCDSIVQLLLSQALVLIWVVCCNFKWDNCVLMIEMSSARNGAGCG